MASWCRELTINSISLDSYLVTSWRVALQTAKLAKCMAPSRKRHLLEKKLIHEVD